jgi:hypothetical protein
MSSLARDLQLELNLQLDQARTVGGPLPSGVADQLDEVSVLMAGYDETEAAIRADVTKSEVGRRGALAEAQAATEMAVGQWRTLRVEGLQAQIAAERSALDQQAGGQLPTPSPLAAQEMLTALKPLDPLERLSLYYGSDPSTQLTMELAAETVGQLPYRRPDGVVVMQPLIDRAAMKQAQASRLERLAGPEAMARIARLEQIARLYEAAAGAAMGLLRQQTR